MGQLWNRYGDVIGTTVGADRTDYGDAAANAKAGGSYQQVPQWQTNLNTYKTNAAAGNTEIQRAKDVWKQKTAAGDTAGADAAHLWANQIRQAMGTSSQYDPDTGASLVRQAMGTSSQYNPDTGASLVQPPPQQPKDMTSILSQLQQPLNTYSSPYEQLLRDLMSQPSAYTMPSESDMLSQSQQYADLQVSPLLSAIQSSLANAQTNYGNEQRAINAAYAGVPALTQGMLDEARRSALESAISRGMGRSGVVDWQTQKLSQPIMQQAMQSEAEKAAKLAAIANTLSTAQAGASQQQQGVETQRGTLQSTQLANLRTLAQQMTAQADAAKWGQGYQLANLANSANQSNYDNMVKQALLQLTSK